MGTCSDSVKTDREGNIKTPADDDMIDIPCHFGNRHRLLCQCQPKHGIDHDVSWLRVLCFTKYITLSCPILHGDLTCIADLDASYKPSPQQCMEPAQSMEQSANVLGLVVSTSFI